MRPTHVESSGELVRYGGAHLQFQNPRDEGRRGQFMSSLGYIMNIKL